LVHGVSGLYLISIFITVLKQKYVLELTYYIQFQSASGTGLAFIIFTEAINQFPGAQFWSILFFLMLFTLGIDSQFGTLEGVVTSIVDMKLFPNLRKEILTGLYI
jgi:solute carrier family 6 amino acid/orphan transporter-like 15/16/17/18/20